MSAITLRWYQQESNDLIYKGWTVPGVDNVLAVLPTGAGKTVLFAHILHNHTGASCAIAHRQELVGQISVALAREGVQHKIIAPKAVVKFCVKLHLNKVGKSFYNPDSQVAVAGVDTLIRRKDPEFLRWAAKVTMWVQDEAHHVLLDNKWGKACEMFTNPKVKGLGVTATPIRADGKGLGRHASGVFDQMIEGPTMRQLIDEGFLTDYRVFAPKVEDLDLSAVPIGASGEFAGGALAKAVKKSKMVGDVVSHYKKFAAGKLGVTFVSDIESAEDVAATYRAEGVPAIALSSKNTDKERTDAVQALENREILQLVNCDLLGEGFDLPAIEVVSFARPTASLSLFIQQFGRALRLLEGKERAIIIDHVGNVERHGLPDSLRVWSLDDRSKRDTDTTDEIPLTVCLNRDCVIPYPRVYPRCPECGTEPTRNAMERSGPEYVDGDLTELLPEVLERMRGAVATCDRTAEEYAKELDAKGCPKIGIASNVKKHLTNQEYQESLRASMAWWAGVQRSKGREDRESYRRFFHMFGVDVLTAQSLKHQDAAILANKINQKLGGEMI